MKIFKHRNLMGCIYAFLMAVPLFSILGRTCYSIFNKNAYESYSGYNNNIQVNEITNFSDITLNNVYHFDHTLGSYPNSSQSDTGKIGYSNLTNLYAPNNDMKNALENGSYFCLYYTNTWQTLYVYDNTFATLYSLSITNRTCQFDFQLTTIESRNLLEQNFSFLFTKTTQQFGNLDNAFDYSLSKFVNDNDFGRLNFFQWFWDIFLTNNQQNNLYIHFVNWYMNFALCLSSAYILFLVLMWFINYSRRILERGMNYDW